MSPECPRESEILECATSGRWPDGCDEELRAHAASCAPCADLVAVTTAIAEEMRAEIAVANAPAAGMVWWRMQRRQRAETSRNAARAITLVQAASVLAALTFALGILGGAAAVNDTCRHALARLADAIHFGAIDPFVFTAPLLFGLAASLLFAPVAVYLAVARD